jgi:hypothetical protein
LDFEPPQHDPASEPAPILPQGGSADQLREQAAACRRLALQSRTRAGKTGLDALGDHLDAQAYKLDPWSLKR